MSVALAKSFVCNGVSTDTRFVCDMTLAASAHRKYLTTRTSLNFMMSIIMIRLTPVADLESACTEKKEHLVNI